MKPPHAFYAHTEPKTTSCPNHEPDQKHSQTGLVDRPSQQPGAMNGIQCEQSTIQIRSQPALVPAHCPVVIRETHSHPSSTQLPSTRKCTPLTNLINPAQLPSRIHPIQVHPPAGDETRCISSPDGGASYPNFQTRARLGPGSGEARERFGEPFLGRGRRLARRRWREIHVLRDG
jgi:hypothetical protein